MAPFWINNGILYLDEKWSEIEENILQGCLDLLKERGFTFLSIPSSIETDSYRRQGIFLPDGTAILGQKVGESSKRLAGSAEQGLLERFCQREVIPQKIVARNQCFRHEAEGYEGLKYVREFQKVEQYVICEPAEWQDRFEEILQNSLDFLDRLEITDRRIVDCTESDPGYHKKKLDIEVYTKAYGWLETHSCSYFADEQSRRYEFTGKDGTEIHTLSNTGIATPRILVPLMEREGVKVQDVASHSRLANNNRYISATKGTL